MSKRVFQHPPEPETGRKYWRSLDQFANKPEFKQWLEREFPQGAAEFNGGEVSRRNFLQIMGASAALAGLSLSACRRPEKHLVPFTKGVEWSIPGKALFFATSMPTRRGAQPLVVATYDGRPTKIEGNPLHAAVKGSTDTWAQSSILDLYDPDRSRDFLDGGKKSNVEAFDKALDAILAKAGDGSGIAFLTERGSSPTADRLRAEIAKKYPNALWAAYEPTSGDAAQDAVAAAFGEGVAPVLQVDKADVIMAVDADFLSCSEGSVQTVRQFTSRRKVEGPDSRMNRLYAVENRYTVTGGMADHRLRIPASQIGAFLVTLASAIGKATGDATLNGLVQSLRVSPLNDDKGWIRESAADLVANKGKSLVLVGERQPAAVQLLGYAINAALGNVGKTIAGRRSEAKPFRKIQDLAKAISEKKVQTLFILGGNPVYNAPSDLNWAELQASVPTVIRLGFYEDETTFDGDRKPRVAWHIPKTHYLESWGDGRATDGSYTAVQPMILPLYGGWSEIDLFARIAGRKRTEGPELVQETFRQFAGNAGDLSAAWAKFLHDGFLANSEAKPEALNYNGANVAKLAGDSGAFAPIPEGAFEVVLVADSKVDDGRFANNGWLQELPDPITKLTWDNAAWISPTSAAALGVDTGDVIRVKLDDKRSIEIAVLVAPGHADNSLTIPLGYGRTVVGRVGRGQGGQGNGVNAYPLLTTAQPYVAVGARVEKTGRTYELAITQEHGAIEGRGADLTREATLERYKTVVSAPEDSEERAYFKKLGMDAHIPKNVSLYTNPPLSDVHAWGMTIDLSTCLGCSACMVACQSENNVPIVGKDQVIGNREMHWLRMDRYFATDNGNVTDPEMLSQPMLCQHCENAPCETVCPVNATVHSEDGINVMAYNRCIGTRYCANNCPFKVRRFNFFDYNQRDVLGHKPGNPFSGLYKWNLVQEKGTPDTIKMQKNPNVTVRMRGVMEKCTFCIQRIQEAKVAAKVHAGGSDQVPRVPADAFTTACAQACPTDAIKFGDFNNPDSEVSKIRKAERGYRLLEYLNVNTRVWYLARIRNPNPKMPDATKIGNFIETHTHGGEKKYDAAAPKEGHI